jgi:hypothetical protein
MNQEIKSYPVVVTRTKKSGEKVTSTYIKTYQVLSEEEKLNKHKLCRSAKHKLATKIRAIIKEFENNYDALATVLKGLEDFKLNMTPNNQAQVSENETENPQ